MGRHPRSPAARRRLLLALLLLALPSLLGCSYYGQAIWGQTRILLARRDVARLAADPGTAEPLRSRLAAVLRIREFASAELHLPDNGSYRRYVELRPREDGGRRRAVVWNVVAAPALDTSPVVWCFPVAGCVAYRGYFAEARARRFAERLEREGYDVHVAGAAAYSTLGWFADPVLSTVIDSPEARLAGLIFHELAHQVVYAKDDSRFNESFATAVEVEGVRRYLEAGGGGEAEMAAYLERQRQEQEVVGLMLSYRDRLQAMYDTDAPEASKLRRKRALFEELALGFRDLRTSWGDAGDAWDGWLDRGLNNARVASTGTYHGLVPAFQALLERHGGDLRAFYAAAGKLAELDPDERERRLAP